VFKLRVASDLLISGPNAPFYKSLIEPMFGSGFAPGTGYSAQRREASFGVGLKGVADADVDTIQQAVLDTFAKVAQEGFAAARVEAVIHQVNSSAETVGFRRRTHAHADALG
jgi:Zn-dependent M16 (insulinase) family peptidase